MHEQGACTESTLSRMGAGRVLLSKVLQPPAPSHPSASPRVGMESTPAASPWGITFSFPSFFFCLFPSVLLLPQSWTYHQFFLRPIKSDFCILADRPNTECTPFLSHEGFFWPSPGLTQRITLFAALHFNLPLLPSCRDIVQQLYFLLIIIFGSLKHAFATKTGHSVC